ncbi:hypothetical protein SynA1560_01155 [Synechococcus sp. A15-60]|nr:hypothetical protein SynA1560_01155 [Synechococcus sp. A15-60]
MCSGLSVAFLHLRLVVIQRLQRTPWRPEGRVLAVVNPFTNRLTMCGVNQHPIDAASNPLYRY